MPMTLPELNSHRLSKGHDQDLDPACCGVFTCSASLLVTVQSRYSWMVAARGSSAFFVPGRGGGACPLSKALNRNGTSARASCRPACLSVV